LFDVMLGCLKTTKLQKNYNNKITTTKNNNNTNTNKTNNHYHHYTRPNVQTALLKTRGPRADN